MVRYPASFRNIGLLLFAAAIGGCGGGGGGNPQSTGTQNPTPVIRSINPSGVVSGGQGFTLTVNGSNFVKGSTVIWDVNSLTTKFVSSSQLQAQVPSSDLLNIATAGVSVLNSTASNNLSNVVTVYIGPNAPSINLLSPSLASVGSNSLTLTVLGSDFFTGEIIEWNGQALTTTFLSPTELQATVPSADFANAGTASVAVVNPPYAYSVSNALLFNISSNTTTALTLDPSSAIAGGSAFVLTVNGSGFTSSSQMQWNGAALPTTLISGNQLQAQIPTADIAYIGTAQVTVADGGTISAALNFLIGDGGGPGYAYIDIPQSVASMAWDQQQQMLYVSVPSASAYQPNTVQGINPYTATIQSAQYAGSDPNVTAVSSDGQYLYVGIDGANAMQRFILPNLTPDIQCSLGDNGVLGPNLALDIQVSPISSNTTAIALGNQTNPGPQTFMIMDGCTIRGSVIGTYPGNDNNIFSIQWDSTGANVYATDGLSLYTLSVDSSGAAFTKHYPNLFYQNPNDPSIQLHFDATTGNLYADDGHVVDPLTGTPLGQYAAYAPMTPDSQHGLAFFTYPVGPSNPAIDIQSFNLSGFNSTGTIPLPDSIGDPIQLIRWGDNGLAMAASDGQLFLVGGTFVTNGLSTGPAGTPPAGPSGTLPLPPPPPAKPVLSSLSTTAVASGGENFDLTVTGSNFTVGEQICWNGTPLSTLLVSSSEMKTQIPASDIANTGTASVTVCYTGQTSLASQPLTLTIGPVVPTAVLLSPAYATAGGNGLDLTVFGQNFLAGDVVQWNGAALSTTFVSATELKAQIPAADVSSTGSYPVTVMDPAYSGSTSNPVMFGVSNSPPGHATLNPGSAVAGSSALELTVNDKNFTPSSTVEWNGTALQTTYISADQLQALIPASDIANPGTATVTVSSGLSVPDLTFFIGTAGGFDYAYIDINQAANDIVWSPLQQLLYISIPASAAILPNTVAALNPYTTSITTSQSTGNNPNVIALSDDGQYLYAGIDGTNSVERFTLPGLTPDITCSLGNSWSALDLQIAPGAPHTFAVSLHVIGISGAGDLAIYDDCTMRSVQAQNDIYGSIQWGLTPSVLYSSNDQYTGGDFCVLSVSSSGVTLSQDYLGTVFDPIHFDAGSGLIYANRGTTVNPNTGLRTGTFGVALFGVGNTTVTDPYLQISAAMDIGPMVPDTVDNMAFFSGMIGTYPFAGPGIAISAYNMKQYSIIDSLILSDTLTANGFRNPTHIVRWGTNGLAMTTNNLSDPNDNHIYLIGGTFVSGP
ncbi:MAG: hypothetical protein ACYDB9_00895 [Gammaproteobacteria bacterium]